MRDKGGLLIALPDTLTMADLRAAWQRCRVLHLRGWTFERALSVPVMVTTTSWVIPSTLLTVKVSVFVSPALRYCTALLATV